MICSDAEILTWRGVGDRGESLAKKWKQDYICEDMESAECEGMVNFRETDTNFSNVYRLCHLCICFKWL